MGSKHSHRLIHKWWKLYSMIEFYYMYTITILHIDCDGQGTSCASIHTDWFISDENYIQWSNGGTHLRWDILMDAPEVSTWWQLKAEETGDRQGSVKFTWRDFKIRTWWNWRRGKQEEYKVWKWEVMRYIETRGGCIVCENGGGDWWTHMKTLI